MYIPKGKFRSVGSSQIYEVIDVLEDRIYVKGSHYGNTPIYMSVAKRCFSLGIWRYIDPRNKPLRRII